MNVGGFVLAGGQSSRMGTNKALLPLAGRPLIQLAVEKLRTVTDDVRILSSDPQLDAFAPLLPDRHPGCGPLGGMEAALAYSRFEWNLFLGVDMPFVPPTLIADLLRRGLASSGNRIALFTLDGRPQPGLCLLHKEILPSLEAAIARREYKLLLAFQSAARALVARAASPSGDGISLFPLTDGDNAQALWFANLNTPEDIRQAEQHAAMVTPASAHSRSAAEL